MCAITGEKGTSDGFTKINGKYYKSKELYDDAQRKKDVRKKIIDTVCFDFLDYSPGQVFPTMLPKKLKELEFYDNEVILQTIQNNASDIKYWLTHKQFESDSGRVAYLFAIVKAHINDEYAAWKRIKSQEEKPITEKEGADILETGRPAARGKDITDWLEDDEL